MRLSDHFVLQELVHPEIYKHKGSYSANYLHHAMVPTLEKLRANLHGSTISVNNWHMGKSRVNSGMRLPMDDFGADMSSHKFGCAVDIRVAGLESDEVFDHILNFSDDYQWICRLEAKEHTPGWTHIGFGKRFSTSIYIFKP